MSVTELMVSICIIAIIAAVAIPSYINYVQQARVVSIIIPNLHMVESNVSLFYTFNNRLPGKKDTGEILKNIDTTYCDISITNGTVVMKIVAREKQSKLSVLDGKVLVASPVIDKAKITSWHLAGELAERLKISY